jgi:beta-alanine--pyruvate transaminase
MGAVAVKREWHDAVIESAPGGIELFHGYTYSGHPLACAAGLAALDLYRDEDLFARAKALEPKWSDAAMTLKGLPNVLDIRCVGITAAFDLASRPDAVGKRGYEAMERGFHDENIMFRIVGDSIAVTPPLIVSESQMAEIFEKIGRIIKALN